MPAPWTARLRRRGAGPQPPAAAPPPDVTTPTPPATSPDGRFVLDPFWPAVVPDEPVAVEDVEVWRADRFPARGPQPWLDRDDALGAIERRRSVGKLTDFEADLCREWVADGFVVVQDLLDPALLDWAWESYEDAIADRVVLPPAEPQFDGDPLPGRMLDPHFEIPAMREVLESSAVVRVVELLLGTRCIPFQTITSHKASLQALHSDSIHMSTYPAGYLVACWIAFEDIEADAGPLEYLPGTHRLPIVTAESVGIPVDAWANGTTEEYDARYTPKILAQRDAWVADGNEVERFHAKKGDILFWHANLLHGGAPRLNCDRSRRALVCHYFAEGCLCFHDWTAGISRVHLDADTTAAIRAADEARRLARRADG